MSRAAEHLIDEMEVIGVVTSGITEWHAGRLTHGQILALIAQAGRNASRAMARGWDFLDERPTDQQGAA